MLPSLVPLIFAIFQSHSNTFSGEEKLPKRQLKQATTNDMKFTSRAMEHEMDYSCEIGDESHTRKMAEKLVKTVQDYYTGHGKGPSESNEEGQIAWKRIEEELPGIAVEIRNLLLADKKFCKIVDGQTIFISRPMEGKEAEKPGNYLKIKFDEEPPKNKIGMSDNVTTGTRGRVQGQIPSDVSPVRCCALLLTRDEAVDIVNRSSDLKARINAILRFLPAFQYNNDHAEKAFDELVNQMMEFTLTAILTRSNGYEIDIGVALERLHNLGSTFVNEMCQFPCEEDGNNEWIIDFMRRTKSVSVIGTWSTAVTELFNLVNSCKDELTVRGL